VRHEPQPSPASAEQGHDEMSRVPHEPQPSLARVEQGHDEMLHVPQQAQPTHEQRVPSQEDHAQEVEDVPEWEARNKIPKKIRPVFISIKDVASVTKWYSHDQFKLKNQVKEVTAQAPQEAASSKLHQAVKKYQMWKPSHGQQIARKNMKEASLSYQIGSSGYFPYT
jgi:hypothetical protein